MKTPSSLFPDLLGCEQAFLCSYSHSCGRSACPLGLPRSDGLYSQSGARANLPDMVSCHVSGQREDKSHQYFPLLYVASASPKEDISGYLPVMRVLRKSSLILDLPLSRKSWKFRCCAWNSRCFCGSPDKPAPGECILIDSDVRPFTQNSAASGRLLEFPHLISKDNAVGLPQC